MKKILLVFLDYSTFVRVDHELLKSKHTVVTYHYKPRRNHAVFFLSYLRFLIFLLSRIWRFDLVYCWFSDYHSFLATLIAKLARKHALVIVGGYDAVSIPEINYGIFFDGGFRSWCARMTYKLTDRIITVDSSLIRGINSYLNAEEVKTGVAHFVKNIEAKCLTVPTGYDHTRWHKTTKTKKEQMVLSVAWVPDVRSYKLKGFDLVIEVANILKHVSFVLVGLQGEALQIAQQSAPKNVDLVGLVPNEELTSYYSRAKVFCQLSMTEGLPNTLCEAMLCECIPVGSNVNGIPKAIGDVGFILKKREVQEAKKLIELALNATDPLGRLARQRIILNYGLGLRREAILKLL